MGVVILGVFQDKTSKSYEAFKEAKFGRTYPKFIWVKDASLASKYLGEAKALALVERKEDAVSVRRTRYGRLLTLLTYSSTHLHQPTQLTIFIYYAYIYRCSW